jgi:hypothetical protein
MKPATLPVKDTIDEGTRYRECHFRIRESGIKELLQGLGRGGFCSLGSGRVQLIEEEGEIFIQFCANVGRYDTRVVALGLDFVVPLTDEEKNFTPPDPGPEQESPDETSPADPVDPDPQL